MCNQIWYRQQRQRVHVIIHRTHEYDFKSKMKKKSCICSKDAADTTSSQPTNQPGSRLWLFTGSTIECGLIRFLHRISVSFVNNRKKTATITTSIILIILLLRQLNHPTSKLASQPASKPHWFRWLFAKQSVPQKQNRYGNTNGHICSSSSIFFNCQSPNEDREGQHRALEYRIVLEAERLVLEMRTLNIYREPKLNFFSNIGNERDQSHGTGLYDIGFTLKTSFFFSQRLTECHALQNL